MDNYLVASFAEHIILTLLTFPDGFSLKQTSTAIITKEPIVILLFRLGSQSFHYGLLELCFFLLSLFSYLSLFLFLIFLSILSLFLSSLYFLSQRISYFTRVLSNSRTSWLLVAEVVLCFVYVHFLTSVLIFLFNHSFLRILLSFQFGRQPLLIQYVILQKQISFVKLFRFPSLFYQLTSLFIEVFGQLF
jgi:hypothetical protein